ncbi:phenylhydantoinase domain protein [Veillonella sp. oral taxon 780 str. F0422]|nr:phenylhydantoinase domain protein [Veillonella sp. oral taxon 780 str. F0422]
MQGTIAIENDTIVEVAPHIEAKPGDVRIDAKGRYVLPGGIDTHTHFEMTNAFATTADDFESGTKAAIMGGPRRLLILHRLLKNLC